MKKINQIVILAFVFGLLIASASCGRNTRYLYKKEKRNTPDTTIVFHNAPLEYHIQPYDVLYLNIQTTNEEINKYFAQDAERSQMGDNRFYLSGYTVNDTGYIQVPVLGMFQVQGKTIKETREEIQERTATYVIDAIVNVKFVDFKITMLGEVPGQGVNYIYQEKIDILEAVARSGGVKSSGNKKNVIVLRETDTGKKMFRIDLTDRDLLTSDKFYLYPNDMIIVEQRQIKRFIGDNLRDFSSILSIMTTTISTTFLIISLTN